MTEALPTYRSLVGELTDDPSAWRRGGEILDPRDGAVYAVASQLRLAVDVALASGRPLLLRGEPGSGKSSLAAYVARNKGWSYYEHVITSTTAAEDLLWRFDAVRRLADAQAQRPIDDARYVEPGPLWWVLDPESAVRRGASDVPEATQPLAAVNAGRDRNNAVLLIDELDKADPDLPNGLLVPLGSRTFTVTETGFVVRNQAAGQLLVVITTNEERQLPPALLRRCVVHTLPTPGVDELVRIATLHVHGPAATAEAEDTTLFTAVAQRLMAVRAELAAAERKPSTAEYLDAVRACQQLQIRPDVADARWRLVEQVTLAKPNPQDAGALA